MKCAVFFLMLPAFMLSQASFKQAEIYYDNEEFQKAKPLFEANLERNPDHAKTREYLGDIASYSNDWDTAISYYETLVEEDPNSANYNFKLGGALGMKAQEISKIRALSYVGAILRVKKCGSD